MLLAHIIAMPFREAVALQDDIQVSQPRLSIIGGMIPSDAALSCGNVVVCKMQSRTAVLKNSISQRRANSAK